MRTTPQWFWYIAGPSEILLDCDSKSRLLYAMFRLGRNIRQEFLSVKDVHVFRSTPGTNKFHVFVRLTEPMPELTRALWQLHLGSDSVRELYTLTRISRGLESPNLLIAKSTYPIPGRLPDYSCKCATKHRGVKVCQSCPVISRLHGKEAGAIYYALRTEHKLKRQIAVKLGRVSLRDLKRM